jgi:hypothetical protein
MISPEHVTSLSREELLALVAELAADNQELRVEVKRLTRQSKRQAVPFSKGTRAKHPKRSGRKPGQGTFSFWQTPPKRSPTPPRNCTDDPGVLPWLRGQTGRGASGLSLHY